MAQRAPVLRYQLGDQLDSTVVELDDAGNLLSYEEFHPYGTTAYESRRPGVSRKRYRFTAKERDDETGLQYHGARYYAPWLGRWLSPDPAGLADGGNRYAYCRGRPTTRNDPSGRQSKIPDEAGAPMPISDADNADTNAPKPNAPPGGGVKEGASGGVEFHDYTPNTDRILVQDQRVDGLKAGLVNTAIDTATSGAKRAFTGGVVIPTPSSAWTRCSAPSSTA